MSKITRIATYRPKLANEIKHQLLARPFAIYKHELQRLVKIQLYQSDIKKFANKDVTDEIDLPARLSQVCAKQASAIVRSIQEKVKLAEKAHNKQKYQQEILNKWNNQTLDIDINSVNIDLDSRFIDIQPNKTTELCDYWIKITSFPRGSFYIPLKLTKPMHNLIVRGYQMKSNAARINSDGSIGIYFTKETDLKIKNKQSVGIDVGRNKVISCSNGVTESTHQTSVPIKQILERIQRQKQTSNQSRRTRNYLINQINYSVKHDVDWTNISQVVIEDLIDMKRNLRWGKKSQFWRVAHIHRQIELHCEENDVRLTRVAAAYTSQTCSVCGFKDRNNRSGEKFRCLSCGHLMDADINAAINICNRGAYSPSTCKNA